MSTHNSLRKTQNLSMHSPLIKTYYSSKSPWEVYQSVYKSCDVSFFLDSVCYHPPDQTYSYIGLNPFIELEEKHSKMSIRGAEEQKCDVSQFFEVMRGIMKRYDLPGTASMPYFSGGAVGFLGYEFVETFERIRFRKKQGTQTPLFFWGIYRDIIVYDHKKKCFYLVAHFEENEEEEAQERLRSFKKFFEEETPEKDSFSFESFRPDIQRSQFMEMVDRAKDYIRAGDIYQANLSQSFSFEIEGSPLKLYEDLRTINPSPFASLMKIRDLVIVSSSPERLVRKKGRFCETRPIAGTRPIKGKDANLETAEIDFLENQKERAEHIMLVDLARNDLGRVCDFKSVKVEEMMSIEKYSHVMHIVSKITGKLDLDKDAFDLIRAMFPGGTITGCPKIRCMEIIDSLESASRGLYTGSIGYLDFNGDMDLNIVIRTLVLLKNKGKLQVGAGIVYDSDSAREYEETLHKGKALTEALAKASL